MPSYIVDLVKIYNNEEKRFNMKLWNVYFAIELLYGDTDEDKYFVYMYYVECLLRCDESQYRALLAYIIYYIGRNEGIDNYEVYLSKYREYMAAYSEPMRVMVNDIVNELIEYGNNNM